MQDWRPTQSQQVELLDGEAPDARLLRANLREMAFADRWLGGQRAIRQRVAQWARDLPPGTPLRVLDVATGGGSLPLALHRWGVRHGQRLTLLASDLSREVLAITRAEIADRPITLLRHDALHMPFADGAIDIATCTQALHHFSGSMVRQFLHEIARVTRLGVIITDLQRSYPAYWAARLFGCGPVSSLSRHDGPLSVLRAYTPNEIKAVAQQTALPAMVRSVAAFRLEITLDKRMQ